MKRLITKNHVPVDKTGLAGWWSYRNTGSVAASGTWKDYSGNGNHGTLAGDAYVNNLGANFDGDNDYVDCGNIANPGMDDFSVMFWLYPNAAATFYCCVNKGTIANTDPGYNIAVSDYGKIQVVFSDGTNYVNNYANQGISLAISALNHVAIVFDRSANVDTYINGVLSAANSRDISTIGAVSNAYNLRLGLRRDNSVDLSGRLDDIMIFKRTLSAGEIKQNCHKNMRS
ncbi:MAG: LamG domain-containing protein [Victivallaceae bacterium]|nr:LamG domain-containing protein [Victivallaceae bacterium]